MSISYVEVADEVYSRLRDLLCVMPEAFCATHEGLTVPMREIDDHVLRFGSAKSIPRVIAASAARADQYLLRTTGHSWILLPQAFGCDDEYLPAGVIDNRAPTEFMNA